MTLTDTHCHLDASAFADDLPVVARHASEQGVSRLVSVGVSPADFPAQRRAMATVAQEGVEVWPAFGTHPWWAGEVSDDQAVAALDAVREHVPGMVAVGEIGLDFGCNVDADRQQALFLAQLEWAGARGLPVILHERKSADRLFYWLRRRQHAGGVVHGFVGSFRQAERFIDQGFFIGVGGAITHPGAHRVHRLVRELPPERLLLETDAPNQPGHAHRGERNLPGYLPEHLTALARLKGMDEGELASILEASARVLFGSAATD
ncbi:MAG: TatD family hydrolase [Pseudomonadota bacterium]